MAGSEVLDSVLDAVGQPSGIFGRVSDPTSKNTGVVMDPLVAKNLKEQEGFKTKEDFRQFLIERLKRPVGSFPTRPISVNLVVVGGQWNPMFTTTDFAYTQTVSVDKWIPRKGIRFNAKPIRMPSPASRKDGTCGI